MARDVGLKTGVPQKMLDAQHWKTLLYGLSGAGKTRTASIWPKPLFFDFDHGLGSVDRKIAWVRISKWDDWTGWADRLMTQRLKVQTLVIDSVNAMQRMAMEHSVDSFNRVKRSHGDIPGMSDYGKMFWDVWRSIDQLLELPYHIVLVAQCQWGDFGELHRPMFVGQAIVEPLLQSMDLIGMVENTGPQEATLSFDRSDAVTKDRFGMFTAESLVNPTWGDMEGRTKGKNIETELPEIQEGKPEAE
jgi:hypothetical protein